MTAAERVLGPEFATSSDGRVRPVGRMPPERWRALADAARSGRTAAEHDALSLLAHTARALHVLRHGATSAPQSVSASGDADITVTDLDADLAE